MNLENFAKMRGLEKAHQSTNSDFLDYLINREGDKITSELLTKRLQFDTVPELYAKVESVCSLLDCSKRQFLEMAVVEAINKAEFVFRTTYEDASGRELGEDV
jgi:hypothetical protein